MVDITSGADLGTGHGLARRIEAHPETSRAGLDYTPPPRIGAFKAAGRHTARVRFLRRAMILGAVFAVSIIAIVAAFDPFRHLPKGVSIAGVGMQGTKITMDSPKLSGVQQGGGPYSVEAKSGIQDITKPSVIELVGINAHVGMADRSTTHILAGHGTYDNKDDTLALDGGVRIANTTGYAFTLKTASVNFRQGVFASNERSRVDLKGGEVSADAMTIGGNGHQIAFRGHIKSTFDPPEEQPEPTQVEPSGTSERP